MYVGVDVGGTKTLIAALDNNGVIKEKAVFPTPKTYDNFLLELKHKAAHLKFQEFKAGGVGLPGRIDRKHGRGISFGNLAWKNVNIQHDLEKIFDCPIAVENDANMAALSEAQLHKQSETVLYITISTGIGTGVTHKQRLAEALLDIEGGHLSLPHKNKLTKWEHFASGKAIVERFGKKAGDIPAGDPAWEEIIRDLALGMFELIAITQPDLIVIGGSVGSYFDRYGELLNKELQKHALPVVPIPEVVEAKRPEEAVIFGCYDLAKQVYGHAAAN